MPLFRRPGRGIDSSHRPETWIPADAMLADFDRVMARYAVHAAWDIPTVRAALAAIPRAGAGWVAYRRLTTVLADQAGKKAGLASVAGMDAVKDAWSKRRVSMTRATADATPVPGEASGLPGPAA